jgi:hypothetical protein
MLFVILFANTYENPYFIFRIISSVLNKSKKSYPHKRQWRPRGCQMLRIPHCSDYRLTDGVGLMHRPRSIPL